MIIETIIVVLACIYLCWWVIKLMNNQNHFYDEITKLKKRVEKLENKKRYK